MNAESRAFHDGSTVVLLLAGGIGSRLNVFVQSRAKPAVPFGGLYRIIDFSLSNVMNSGLNQIGVLTQYKPLSLMRHLRSGEAWDFTGRSRGVKILPPRTGSKDSDWYKGTADAVRQNIDFLKSHPSSEVLILSGDHIYQMDLARMIDFHREKEADVTVAMMEVDIDKIHQFGTGITDPDGRIVEWEEKPEKPRTNLASMGIYVFDTGYLLETLERDRREIDFGMHIIPTAIAKDDVFAYPFQGYWRDVGTIQAFWEANMDIIRPDSGISPQAWGICSNPETDGMIADRPPARFAAGCRVRGSMISAGCVIEGEVVNSVLSPGVVVRAGASVRDAVVFSDCLIEADAMVDLAVLDRRVTVKKGAVVGCGEDKELPNRLSPKHLFTGITVVGKEAVVSEGMKVGRNCIVNPNARPEPGTVIESGGTF
ncbi:MAG: NTP transferase domain-containing protein [Proteobacteria bacterium]|nr:NTP transferase domain-containing protein [Pseudomonadota bacterium]MBU1738083.1 NTP transferase domain-containing protein [Pseudomonadota bacterium]